MAAKNAASQFVGNIGEKVTLTCTIDRIFYFQNDYGLQSIFTMWCDGNVIVYKGSACLGEKGDIIEVSAKVKKHDVYNGTKQTVLLRPRVIG